MHNRDLIRQSGTIDMDIIYKSLMDKKILFSDDQELPENIDDFFDIVVTDSIRNKDKSDIFMPKIFSSIGVPNNKNIIKSEGVLYLLSHHYYEVARKKGLKFDFCSLSYNSVIYKDIYSIIEVWSSQLGKNNIYATFASDSCIYLDNKELIGYISAIDGKYLKILKNLRCPNRKKLLNDITWWEK